MFFVAHFVLHASHKLSVEVVILASSLMHPLGAAMLVFRIVNCVIVLLVVLYVRMGTRCQKINWLAFLILMMILRVDFLGGLSY